jgi:hypothetical protein
VGFVLCVMNLDSQTPIPDDEGDRHASQGSSLYVSVARLSH